MGLSGVASVVALVGLPGAGILGVAWSDIFVGLLAAGIVGAAGWTRTRVRNRYLEHKFPIAGDYITAFEDGTDEDGNPTFVNAPARLRQRGKTVEGVTTMPDEERTWILEGEISEQGYINGVYYAEDPHDKGIGNFILYIDRDRRLEGIWSGYGDGAEEIISGQYVFVPMLDGVEVRELRPEDVPSVLAIADDQLGTDYLDGETVAAAAGDDDTYFGYVAVVDPDGGGGDWVERLLDRMVGSRAVTGGDDVTLPSPTAGSEQVAGFCLCGAFDQSGLAEHIHVDRERLPAGIRHADSVGMLLTGAVRSGYQHRGIGTELGAAAVDACEARAPVTCSVAWEDGEGVAAAGILEYLDFERVATFEEYWRADSEARGYECARCGDPPCTCRAALYGRFT